MEGPEADQSFRRGKFLRQKCYCLADENYNIYSHKDKYGNFSSKCVCAGMPDEVKETMTWDEFHLGKTFLKKQHCLVPGGVCLELRPYTLGANL